uniref:Uncharacterized protein n=1 Tax=Oryza nivara TaxID=4536 RepID=A0A0E0HKA9_ORYNI
MLPYPFSLPPELEASCSPPPPPELLRRLRRAGDPARLGGGGAAVVRKEAIPVRQSGHGISPAIPAESAGPLKTDGAGICSFIEAIRNLRRQRGNRWPRNDQSET